MNAHLRAAENAVVLLFVDFGADRGRVVVTKGHIHKAKAAHLHTFDDGRDGGTVLLHKLLVLEKVGCVIG